MSDEKLSDAVLRRRVRNKKIIELYLSKKDTLTKGKICQLASPLACSRVFYKVINEFENA